MIFKSGDSVKTSVWEVEMTFDMKEKEYKFKYRAWLPFPVVIPRKASIIVVIHWIINATLGIGTGYNQLLNLWLTTFHLHTPFWWVKVAAN